MIRHRRRFRLLGAILAALLGAVALGATAVAATRGPVPAGSAYLDQTLGFEVQLPAEWRRSARLSTLTRTTPLKLGHDVFTIRGLGDEDRALIDPGPGAAWSFVAVVEQYRDPQGVSGMAWATDPLLAGWAKGQTVEAATLDGHPAAKVTNGARFSVAYYVPDGGRMFVVGYKVDAPEWKPDAATESALRAIVASFHVTP